MRSERTIKAELKRIEKLLHKGQPIKYYTFLLGTLVGLLWATELNGSYEKSRTFPRPSDELRKIGYDREDGF